MRRDHKAKSKIMSREDLEEYYKFLEEQEKKDKEMLRNNLTGTTLGATMTVTDKEPC